MFTHGGEPSVEILGDLQTFSNIEAGFSYGFYQVYYQYESEDFWLKLGQQDINTDFFISTNSLLFTHSSFGISAPVAVNLPAPTYPATAFAVASAYTITQAAKIRLSIWDGEFTSSRGDFLPIDWSMTQNQGFIYVVEGEYSFLKSRII